MADEKVPSVDEIKAIMANGDVSDEAKRNLVLVYRNRGHDPDGELDQYMDKYDDSGWRTAGEGFTAWDLDDHLTESYDEAKKQADAAGDRDRKHDEAIKGGQATIDGTQRAADNGEKGGAGADSSDELLDAGNAGLRFFRDLLPVYHRIGAIKDDKAGVGQVKQAEDRFHEQRGIQFAKFARGTEDLKAAERGMRKAHEDMSTRLGQLWNGWSGAASDSSQQFFSGKFTPTVNERVINAVSTAAQSTTAAMKGLGDLCREKSRYVLELEKRRGQVTAGKSTKDWDTTIDLANGNQDDEVLRKVAAIWDIEIGECNWGDVDDRTKQEAVTKAQDMTNSFAEAMETEWENFDKKCTDTKNAVDEAWKKLNEELGKAEENPFGNPGPAKDESAPQGPGQQSPGQQGPGGGPSGSGPSGGSPGGAPGGSPGGSPGGAAAMPETPAMPEAPKMPEAPETPEVPGMPQPGGAGGPGAPEVETVGEGKDAVQVQEPDQQGTSQVTIIGEDGKPKTYDVRFGPEGGMPGVGTNPTPGAMPGQPGMPGAGTNPTPGSMPGQPGGVGAPVGPDGANPAAPGGQAPQPGIPVVPGEDGKAVIHEGDRTITLERAPDGSIKVDVDNGGGEPPLQETVEFGADDQPGADARTAAPGAVPGAPPAPPGAEPIGQDAVGAPVGRDPGASFDPSAPVGTPPQVGGFDAPPASGGTEPVVPAASATSAVPEAAAVPDGPAQTAPQSAGLASSFTGEGVSGSFASMSGQLFAGDLGAEPPAQHPTPFGGPPPQAGATGLASADDAASGSPQGATGMGTMADPAAAQGGGQQQAGGGAMGGGMMGGMGGGGQQGGGSGDQERTNSSPWRTQGQLFDDVADDSGSRHRAVLGEDRQG